MEKIISFILMLLYLIVFISPPYPLDNIELYILSLLSRVLRNNTPAIFPSILTCLREKSPAYLEFLAVSMFFTSSVRMKIYLYINDILFTIISGTPKVFKDFVKMENSVVEVRIIIDNIDMTGFNVIDMLSLRKESLPLTRLLIYKNKTMKNMTGITGIILRITVFNGILTLINRINNGPERKNNLKYCSSGTVTIIAI